MFNPCTCSNHGCTAACLPETVSVVQHLVSLEIGFHEWCDGAYGVPRTSIMMFLRASRYAEGYPEIYLARFDHGVYDSV